MPATAIIAIVLTATLGFLDLLRLGFNLYLSMVYRPDHATGTLDISAVLGGPGAAAAAAFAAAIILLFAKEVGRIVAIAVAGASAFSAAMSLPGTVLRLLEYRAFHLDAGYFAFDLTATALAVTVMVLLSSEHVSRWLHKRRKPRPVEIDTPTKRPVGVTIASGLIGVVWLGWLAETYFAVNTTLTLGSPSQLQGLASHFGFLVVLLAALVAVVLTMIGKRTGWTLAIAIGGVTFIHCYRNLVFFATSLTVDTNPAPTSATWITQFGLAVALVASTTSLIILSRRRQLDWFYHNRLHTFADKSFATAAG